MVHANSSDPIMLFKNEHTISSLMCLQLTIQVFDNKFCYYYCWCQCFVTFQESHNSAGVFLQTDFDGGFYYWIFFLNNRITSWKMIFFVSFNSVSCKLLTNSPLVITIFGMISYTWEIVPNYTTLNSLWHQHMGWREDVLYIDPCHLAMLCWVGFNCKIRGSSWGD